MRHKTVLVIFVSLLAIGLVCDETFFEETFSLQQEETITEFVLVIDKSGSMRGDRIQEAKRAATQFVEALTAGQRAAVIAFDDRAEIVHEMSDDKSSITQAIQEVTAGFWTAYVPALQTAQQQFSEGANKIIVFLSDGVDEEPERVSAALQGLLDQDICVYTVAYAADEGADVLLGGMAEFSQEITGCGSFFEARENGFDLEYVFSTLHTQLTGQQVIDVQTNIVQGQVRVQATYNGQSLFAEETCFSPRTTLTIWDEQERIVFREQAPENQFSVSLTQGSYRYETTVTETCQGTCFVYGVDEGVFSTEQELCTFTEQDYFLLQQPDIVRITPDGFTPRTLGTSGVVLWTNHDTKPRQVVSTQGLWESPMLEPQENWSKTFPEGTHGYTDEDGSFQGSIRTTKTAEPSQFVFVFDNSGSMAGEPIEIAKQAAISFVDLLGTQDRASFIVFDQRVRLLQASHTTDKNRLKLLIQGIRAEGFSLYIPALRLAGEQLDQPVARQPIVIFISDGLPRDPEGLEGILNAIDVHLPRACLHVIAYLSDDSEARDLLQAMAEHSERQTRCGAFYTVASDGQELRSVLGEIYVGAQQQLLEFSDLEMTRQGSEYTITTQLRSTQTGLYVPSDQDACLPPATVRARIGVEEYLLVYQDDRYEVTITLPRNTREVELFARLTAQDTAQTATGYAAITVPSRLPYGWLALVVVGLMLVWYANKRLK